MQSKLNVSQKNGLENPKTYGLVFETSGINYSIALFNQQEIIDFYQEEENKPAYISFFMKNLEEFLKKNNVHNDLISHIIINRGPGRFTSTRFGVTITRLWVQVKKIPYIALSSFDFFYQEADFYIKNLKKQDEVKRSYLIFIVLKTESGKIFFSIYEESNFIAIQDPLYLNLDEFLIKLKEYEQIYPSHTIIIGGNCFLNEDFFAESKTFQNKIHFLFKEKNKINLNAKDLGHFAYLMYKKKIKSFLYDYKLLTPLYFYEIK